MHKFFAKTSFVGKNIIYLPDCHSTNSLLSQYVKDRKVKPGTIVFTDFQSAGKGQRGNQWQSRAAENLLFSVYIRPRRLEAKAQYLINLLTSLSVVRAIEEYHANISKLEIKWPNDIYLTGKKLAGILIEAQLSGKSVEHVVIGVGLNVHQRSFGVANATSLDAENYPIDRWELLESFALSLEQNLELLDNAAQNELRQAYLERMRWLNEPHQYQITESGELFEGEIAGIDDFGRLIIAKDDGKQTFDIQQIKFMV
ncbi:MAG: biotin--[acetyl-CoA-carboxylase] ligase [Bacteroidota bacterium]